MAIDVGMKRCGIAISDREQLIAGPLEVVERKTLELFVKNYLLQEPVETIVLGHPKTLQGEDNILTDEVRRLAGVLNTNHPDVHIAFFDERYTSKMAFQAMIDGGMRKKERRKKENIDLISAVLILQGFMEWNTKNKTI